MEIIQFGRKLVDFLGHLMPGHQFQRLFLLYGNLFKREGFFLRLEDEELLVKAKLDLKHVWPGVVVDEQHTAPTLSTCQTSLHVSVPAVAGCGTGVALRENLLLVSQGLIEDLTKL